MTRGAGGDLARTTVRDAVAITDQMISALDICIDAASHHALRCRLDELDGAFGRTRLSQISPVRATAALDLSDDGPPDRQHQLANALHLLPLCVSLLYELPPAPMRWDLQRPLRGPRPRAATFDEMINLRVAAEVKLACRQDRPAAAYALFEAGECETEATMADLDDVRGDPPDEVAAHGGHRRRPRTLILDRWQSHILWEVKVLQCGKRRRRSDGLAYRGRFPGQPAACASVSLVVQRLIDEAGIGRQHLQPRGISIARATFVLLECRNWRAAATILGLPTLDGHPLAYHNAFGRLCSRCCLDQDDAIDALRGAPVAHSWARVPSGHSG